jgi:hypothetical protein
MERVTLSAYQYLTFLLPGGLLLGTFVYGLNGWPLGDPGAAVVLGLTLAAFMIGHALAGIANFLQPVWWGHLPGQRLRSSEGLFVKGGRFAGSEEAVRSKFAQRYPKLETFDEQFGIAYSEAQAGPLGSKMQALVEQIGFYRSAATASLLCLLSITFFGLVLNRAHMPLIPWAPVFLSLTLLYGYRFKRFWRLLAEYVVAEVFRQSKENSA